MDFDSFSNSFRQRPFFHKASQSKMWNNPSLEDSRHQSRPKPFNSLGEASKTLREHRTLFSPTASQLNPINPNTDPEIIHKVIYKGVMTSRSPPLKLEKFLSEVNKFKNPSEIGRRTTRLKSRTSDLNRYLEYLSSNSNEDLHSFKKKMAVKLEINSKKKPEASLYRDISQNWMNDLLPKELKDTPALHVDSNKLNYLNMVPFQGFEENGLTSEFKSSSALRINKGNQSPLKKLKKTNTEKLFIGEEGSEEEITQRLAEDICNSYRIYQENTTKNRELQGKTISFLKEEGVLDLFLGRVYRHLPLLLRILNYMFESGEKNGFFKLMPIGKTPKNKGLSTGFFIGKRGLIHSRFYTMQRINEKLQNFNTEYKVQELQSLENKLLQAHSDFKDRRTLTFRRIDKANKSKYQDMKLQCESLETLIPIYDPIYNEKSTQNYELAFAEIPKATLETRILNKKLDHVFKSWENHLIESSREALK